MVWLVLVVEECAVEGERFTLECEPTSTLVGGPESLFVWSTVKGGGEVSLEDKPASGTHLWSYGFYLFWVFYLVGWRVEGGGS